MLLAKLFPDEQDDKKSRHAADSRATLQAGVHRIYLPAPVDADARACKRSACQAERRDRPDPLHDHLQGVREIAVIHQPGALAGLSSPRKAVQSFRDGAMDFRVPASPPEMVYDCTDATEDRTSIARSNRRGSGDSGASCWRVASSWGGIPDFEPRPLRFSRGLIRSFCSFRHRTLGLRSPIPPRRPSGLVDP
jgi:hypothetical protein